ncbi:ATP-binding cassette domain-containing protein [Bifidobacterium jacchi]|uniref:ATP-binding cassette domain-containing protein n=1 Tax=Bifidobacterium jacchi TaxID=2490545 RepID=A0A5N5RLE8_9BIFI|nr:ATP-binding cassette domain-containing protein [Bifidobacterium jacchi]
MPRVGPHVSGTRHCHVPGCRRVTKHVRTDRQEGHADVIRFDHLKKSYGTGAQAHEVLHDINLTINDGEVFGILGSSGAGKSTLVRTINLLERPTSGRVLIDGVDVTDVTGGELTKLRSTIGMIFQDFSLFQQRTVLRNVTFPLELAHRPKAQRVERARRLLRLVGLEGFENRYPSQLSGGQQQRVAIARALANEPKIMLCDEATSALDSTTTVQILDLLRRINRDLGVTLVVITHSLSVARNICDRVAMIDGGNIVEMGDTAELFANPHSDVLKSLIASANEQNGRDESDAAGQSAQVGGAQIGTAQSVQSGQSAQSAQDAQEEGR